MFRPSAGNNLFVKLLDCIIFKVNDYNVSAFECFYIKTNDLWQFNKQKFAWRWMSEAETCSTIIYNF
jgi:hypothetical protein